MGDRDEWRVVAIQFSRSRIIKPGFKKSAAGIAPFLKESATRLVQAPDSIILIP
jgi:hypothetical protein